MSDNAKFVLKNLAAGALAWVGGELARRAHAWWKARHGEDDPLDRIEERLIRIEEALLEES